MCAEYERQIASGEIVLSWNRIEIEYLYIILVLFERCSCRYNYYLFAFKGLDQIWYWWGLADTLKYNNGPTDL